MQGAAGCQAGRTDLRDHRRHAMPSTGWPPAGHLLWQAPPWHEQGHGHPAPGTSGWVSRPLPGAANDLTAAPDLGHPARVGRLWAGSAGRL